MDDSYIFIVGFGIFMVVMTAIGLMMTVTYQVASKEAETNQAMEKSEAQKK